MPIHHPPVGQCIYCGSADKVLTTEHIIPESLNGQNELPESSCLACAKIINTYETTVGRTIFGDFRIKYGLRSKRPRKTRPKTIEIEFTKDPSDTSNLIRKTIQRDEFPAPTIFYNFGKANLLRGLPYGTGIFDFKPLVLVDESEMQAFHRAHGHSVHRFRASPYELARMLAKIAHGFAVIEFGIEGFIPMKENIDTILKRTNDVGYTVGGSSEIYAPVTDKDHLVEMFILTQPYTNLIVCKIRLFCSISAPTFHVIVGTLDLNNILHARKFLEKCASAKFEVASFTL